MMDVDVRYTARQRQFESKLSRYKLVLKLEKEKSGIAQLEALLSKQDSRSRDPDRYLQYLLAAKTMEERMNSFYRQEKWRGWKFRIYCNKKSSEYKLLNRIADRYGSDCSIYFGNWSRKTQMKGCHPTLNLGLKRLISKRFRVTEVDKFRTSKTCNQCMGEQKSYRKKNGRLSRARLYCDTCGGESKKPSKRFVNRY